MGEDRVNAKRPVADWDVAALVNQTLDEVLAEQEGDFDADSRWALAWFEQSGFAEGEYGTAETLSKAKNTSAAGMVEAGIVTSKGGKVRLVKPSELPEDWDPATDPRLTAWEVVHHLIRRAIAGTPRAIEVQAPEVQNWFGVSGNTAREWLGEWTTSEFLAPIRGVAGVRVRRYRLSPRWAKLVEQARQEPPDSTRKQEHRGE